MNITIRTAVLVLILYLWKQIILNQMMIHMKTFGLIKDSKQRIFMLRLNQDNRSKLCLDPESCWMFAWFHSSSTPAPFSPPPPLCLPGGCGCHSNQTVPRGRRRRDAGREDVGDGAGGGVTDSLFVQRHAFNTWTFINETVTDVATSSRTGHLNQH